MSPIEQAIEQEDHEEAVVEAGRVEGVVTGRQSLLGSRRLLVLEVAAKEDAARKQAAKVAAAEQAANEQAASQLRTMNPQMLEFKALDMDGDGFITKKDQP